MVLEIPGGLFGQDDVRESPTQSQSQTLSILAPIGAIIPWLKSFTNTPTLPDGWVECNGATLSDSASPYNGQVIPDLNGDAKFLRGADTSGGTGGATTDSQQPRIAIGASTGNDPNSISTVNTISTRTADGLSNMARESDRTGSGGVATSFLEARTESFSVDTIPPYYSVVYVMRVK